MLTTKECAKRMEVSGRTIRYWIKKGYLPNAYMLGRDWVIPVEDIENVEVPPPGNYTRIGQRSPPKQKKDPVPTT